MKQIEKENGQIFEVYTKQEFIEMVRFLDWSNDGYWDDEDASLYLKYKDGTSAVFQKGDKKKPLRLNNITKGIYHNPATIAFYNYQIIKNEKYEDYDVE